MTKHYAKGKSYEEIYGIDRAKEIKLKRGTLTKGKTYEEMYGPERAKELKERHSQTLKNTLSKIRVGKTYEEYYGKEKADKLREKLTISKELIINKTKELFNEHGSLTKSKFNNLIGVSNQTIRNKFGSLDALANEVGICFAKSFSLKRSERTIKQNKARSIPKEDIINKTKELFNEHGSLTKSKFNNLIGVNNQTIRNKFGSLDALAEEANIHFKPPELPSGIGKNEIIAREYYSRVTGHEIIPHYVVATEDKTYIIDWFDKTLNCPVELDEPYHKYRKIEDQVREMKVIKTLKCNPFIRLEERTFMQKIQNQSLDIFSKV